MDASIFEDLSLGVLKKEKTKQKYNSICFFIVAGQHNYKFSWDPLGMYKFFFPA